MPRDLSARWMLLRWSGWFALANGVLAVLISTLYLRYAQLESPAAAAYAALALPSHMGLIPVLALLVLWPLALGLPWRRIVMPVAVLMAAVGQILLLIDTEVFAQYRFHLNGFLLDMFVHAGSDLFSLTWDFSLLAGAVVLAVAGLELALALLCWRWSKRTHRGIGFAAVAILALMQAGMHGWHAWASATFDARVTTFDRILPLFYPMTAYDFLVGRGWVDETRPKLATMDAVATLDYPRAPLGCAAPSGSDRLNVLMIVIDAWRADSLTPETTPSIARFAARPAAIRFADHISGGNSTQAGIFSLFYGLPGTYWDAFSTAQRPPVLIEELQRAGYHVEALGSAKLTRPAFDRTVFASVPNLRRITPGANAWEQDARINADFLRFLDERESGAPFLGFLFYNSVHNYEIPPDFRNPFQPAWSELNKLALGPDLDPAPLHNLYKGALLYVDGLVGQVLAALDAKRLLDRTIVMITSDHGEEFNDNGQNFWGHGSNYTDVQVKVPFVMLWPGREGGVLAHTTSHMDVAPTLLQALLGCRAPPADYSVGRSLFSQSPRDWVLISSYVDYAVRTPDHIVQAYRTGAYQVLDRRNRPVDEFELDGATAAEVFAAMSRFYR